MPISPRGAPNRSPRPTDPVAREPRHDDADRRTRDSCLCPDPRPALRLCRDARPGAAARVRPARELQPQDVLVQRRGRHLGARARGDGLGEGAPPGGADRGVELLRQPAHADRRRERPAPGEAPALRQGRRPLRRQHDGGRRGLLRPGEPLGPRAPRAGLRRDARGLGRAGGAVPRAAAARAVDTAMSVTPFFVDWYYLFGARVLDTVNARSFTLAEVRNAKAAALDYYAFVRKAYLQRRSALISGGAELSPEEQQELYYPHLEEENP